MADRRYGSEDMESERHQDRIDADREAHGYRCLRCDKRGMTEDEFMAHDCPEDDEDDDEGDE